MKTLIQLQDAVIARLTKTGGSIHPQTSRAAWNFFKREMTALGFTARQIECAYSDARDMALLNLEFAAEIRKRPLSTRREVR